MERPSVLLTSLEDPRGSNVVHRPGDIILIAVASALGGGATCVAIAQFASAFADSLDGVVAIDGKALRRAHVTGMATAPPLMVTAWAANARLALAGVMPDLAKGENEVTAALAVLDLLT